MAIFVAETMDILDKNLFFHSGLSQLCKKRLSSKLNHSILDKKCWKGKAFFLCAVVDFIFFSQKVEDSVEEGLYVVWDR